ncbi:MAG TPA: DUF4010 domain-containing protein, partial [Gemmatimonadaceae bacterium]|nr:DUF4010 domain-containing protein [Gemmatimonadaceae bacterium]
MDQPIALQTLSMPGELQAATRLVVAALAGFAIGIEREWSRHTVGDARSFAGARTFLALGIVGGICGLLLSGGYAVAGAALLGVTGALVVVGYQHSVRGPTGDPGGTTETAALATLGLAALAGVGSLRIAGGCAALIALMLREKAALHGLIRRIDKPELHAATQFAVLALVVLPVLPVGPYGPLGGVRPRALWAIVLLFCGVNFLGYLARRAVGVRRGYGLAGMLGGLVSSTGVTLHFSRRSREQPALADGLALGVLGACLVLLPRVVIVSAALAPPVALALLPLLALPV